MLLMALESVQSVVGVECVQRLCCIGWDLRMMRWLDGADLLWGFVGYRVSGYYSLLFKLLFEQKRIQFISYKATKNMAD